MFDTILYPTDFSDVSQKALSFIKQFREYRPGKVVALHVIHRRIMESLSIHAGRIDLEQLEEDLKDSARMQLSKINNQLRVLGFSVKTVLRIGVPLSEILKVEAEEDPSIIVIGSHGKTNLEEVLLGSVSEKVIRQSKKPVLVVKR